MTPHHADHATDVESAAVEASADDALPSPSHHDLQSFHPSYCSYFPFVLLLLILFLPTSFLSVVILIFSSTFYSFLLVLPSSFTSFYLSSSSSLPFFGFCFS